jgi:hypothetical protein
MSRKQKLILWPALIGTSMVLGTLLLAVGSTGKSKNRDEFSAGQLTLMRGPVQHVRFTVYEVGIYPRQLRARTGIVGISIEDRTGQSVGLLIEKKDGDGRVPIGQVLRPTNQVRGRELFNLPPGNYRVSDITRQASEAELTVEPK